MRVLIAGGGTGGHIIPALAIADALRARFDAEIRFVGTARGLEGELVPRAGYPLTLIAAGQLNNVSLGTRLRTAGALPLGMQQCIALLRRWKPDVVVGVGGYASGPAMLAAILLRVPTLAFEPNAVPGLANRLIGKRVRAAAVNFPPTTAYFTQAQVTGIPVRAEFFGLTPKPAGTALRLLVFGGSQGARALNSVMPEVAPGLLAALPDLHILHQAGARHAETTEAAYRASGAPPERWTVRPFLHDMPQRFAEADLILARSGASTIAELAAAGKPALLIPFPLAADDHQRKNAEVMIAAGAAEMIVERDLTPAVLLESLVALLGNPKRLYQMGERARTLAHPDAAVRIAGMVGELAGRATRQTQQA